MDALDYLKIDHNRVKNLLRSYSGMQDQLKKKQTLKELLAELSNHTEIEETLFYPHFDDRVEMKAILEHLHQDHADFEVLAGKVQFNTDDSLFDEFASEIERHVLREEMELFPLIRRMMKRSEREVLGRHLQCQKTGNLRTA
ncbi:MAG: hemerythrin domain-containing protein [Methylotenera sp.]|nr:hemerythrin domain-containing protein [Oligoflexia bacterium]